MRIEAKVRRFGDSLGIILPEEVRRVFRVEEGATLYLDVSACSPLPAIHEGPKLAKSRRIAARGMTRYGHALRKLGR